MDHMFPVGFPSATAFYLTLYVLTFALHQFFMHYVVAGSLYVVWATVFPGRGEVPRSDQPLAATLRDWMPFMLSAAITAGVAPLLFVQIVYPRHFYTANLLLGWRWMIVIPVLIAAFYLLYLIKSSATVRWPYPLRAAVPITIVICFLFVGFCWSANHLLSNTESKWPEIYASGSVAPPPLTTALRMLVWIGGAFASMTLVAGWQLSTSDETEGGAARTREIVRLSWMSWIGLLVAAAAAAGYIADGGENTRSLVFSPLMMPYLVIAIVGIVLQAVAWATQLRRRRISRGILVSASFGCFFALVGAAVLRESLRLATVDVTSLYDHHTAAASIGGFFVFSVFAVVNSGLIVGCILLVRRGLAAVTRSQIRTL